MIIAGIDFSITCPAVCIHDTSSQLSHSAVTYQFLQKNPSQKEIARWEASNYRFDNIICNY